MYIFVDVLQISKGGLSRIYKSGSGLPDIVQNISVTLHVGQRISVFPKMMNCFFKGWWFDLWFMCRTLKLYQCIYTMWALIHDCCHEHWFSSSATVCACACVCACVCERERAEIYIQICVSPRLHKHMFSCNYQHFVGVRELVCVILPLKIINTGVAPGRPAAYSAWLSTMLQKWSHILIHPSLSWSIPLSLPLRLKKGHCGLSSRQQSDQTRVQPDPPSPSPLPPPLC